MIWWRIASAVEVLPIPAAPKMASLAGGVVCWIRSMAVATYSSLPKKMSEAGGGLVDRSTLLQQPISINNSLSNQRGIYFKSWNWTSWALPTPKWDGEQFLLETQKLTQINVVYLISFYGGEGAPTDIQPWWVLEHWHIVRQMLDLPFCQRFSRSQIGQSTGALLWQKLRVWLSFAGQTVTKNMVENVRTQNQSGFWPLWVTFVEGGQKMRARGRV